MRRRLFLTGSVLVLALAASSCGGGGQSATKTGAVGPVNPSVPPASRTSSGPGSSGPAGKPAHPLPGMPPVPDPNNIYAADFPSDLAPATRGAKHYVYVPDTISNDVYVIDQRSMRIVDHFPVGRQPQHVVPSYDLTKLWATNDLSNTLTEIDPKTGKPTKTVHVADPYNMYYTPNGRYALVVAERLQRLDFLDPKTMQPQTELPVDCPGIDHLDFSANGQYLIASCEFSGKNGHHGKLIKVDVTAKKVVGSLTLPAGAVPQDVKLAPDGSVFYTAGKSRGGVYLVTGDPFRKVGFAKTGKGAHGLYVSRNAKDLYVTNRGEGSVSVLDFATRKPVAKWRFPGASPDMGNVSVDGSVLWLSGRYDGVVYALSTKDGHMIKKFDVGKGPHGLCVWPQPGRYSTGHTGIMR